MTVLIIGGAYQGKKSLAKKLYPGLELVENLHIIVRDMLEHGEEPSMLLEYLSGKCVTCDEIGCGIVPIGRKDAGWREAVGRLCCALAQEADVVIRVSAGIPQFLKGDMPGTV